MKSGGPDRGPEKHGCVKTQVRGTIPERLLVGGKKYNRMNEHAHVAKVEGLAVN